MLDQPCKQEPQQSVLLRPDPGQAGDRNEQGIEQFRAHYGWKAHFGRTGRRYGPDLNAFRPDCNASAGADRAGGDRYIRPTRHVRAFGVWTGWADDGYDTIEQRSG